MMNRIQSRIPVFGQMPVPTDAGIPSSSSPPVVGRPMGTDAVRFGRGKLSQQELDQQLQRTFALAFNNGNVQSLSDFADAQMPTLTPTAANAVTGGLRGIQDGLAEKAQVESGKIRLTLDKMAKIRLYYDGQEVTTNKKNIPDYPWFTADDPDGIAAYAADHVAGGIRVDTWHEKDWPKVGGIKQGEQNWPPPGVRNGPYRLSIVKDGDRRAIRLALPPGKEKNDYGVVPRGMFWVNPDSSITMAFQNENRSDLGLEWAAWFVLGFGMPDVKPSYTDPSVIFAWPDTHAKDPVQDSMTKVWNYADIKGKKMALINPHVKTLNETFKKFYRDTNWNVIAQKGSPYIILSRSVLRHNEQYFPFLEHGRYFVEAEYTGKKVKPGETSTVLVKHEFVNVAELTGGRIQRLSTEKGQFEKDVREVLGVLVDLDKAGKLVTNYKD